jgi:multiple sugar transport system permease protein
MRAYRPRHEVLRSRNVVGVLIGVLFVLPVCWLIITALTPPSGLGKFPPPLLPNPPTLANFREAFGHYGFGHFLLNSIIVSVASTCAVLALAVPASYALARTRMRGKGPVLVALLVVAVFPQIAIVVPLYVIFQTLGLLNSYQGLVIAYTGFNLPFAIWIMRNTFKAIPVEMEEAGEIDGAPLWRIVVQLVLPQAVPGVFVAGILTFVACWTEFLMALSFNPNAAYQTVPVGIALFGGNFTVPFGTIFAASFVALVPVLALALGLRRWVIAGLSGGATKG